jgi:hypothetical protein
MLGWVGKAGTLSLIKTSIDVTSMFEILLNLSTKLLLRVKTVTYIEPSCT